MSDESNGVDNEATMTHVNKRNPMMAPGSGRINNSSMPRVNERKRSGEEHLKRTTRYDPIMRLPLRSNKHQMTLDGIQKVIAMGCPPNDMSAKIGSFCKRAALFLTMLRKQNDLFF